MNVKKNKLNFRKRCEYSIVFYLLYFVIIIFIDVQFGKIFIFDSVLMVQD